MLVEADDIAAVAQQLSAAVAAVAAAGTQAARKSCSVDTAQASVPELVGAGYAAAAVAVAAAAGILCFVVEGLAVEELPASAAAGLVACIRLTHSRHATALRSCCCPGAWQSCSPATMSWMLMVHPPASSNPAARHSVSEQMNRPLNSQLTLPSKQTAACDCAICWHQRDAGFHRIPRKSAVYTPA